MRQILIIEDAGSDRRRFRILMDEALHQIRLKGSPEFEYRFAWDARTKRVPWDLATADKGQVLEFVNKFDHVFLDLAWTKREEDVMNRARRQSRNWLFENADNWSEQGKVDMAGIKLAGDGLISNISGLRLMDIHKNGLASRAKIIVATGFYSTALADFCWHRWTARAFKKWEDQTKLEAFMY